MKDKLKTIFCGQILLQCSVFKRVEEIVHLPYNIAARNPLTARTTALHQPTSIFHLR
jgi:hypothetical protein